MQCFNLSTIMFLQELQTHTRGFSASKIKKAFHFGSDKVSRTIKSYKLNKVVPKSPMRGPTKLTAEVLAYIHTMLYADAHSTLELIKSSVEQRFNIAIALSTVSRGCKQLNYKYKPPKRKQKLEEDQMIAKRIIEIGHKWEIIAKYLPGRSGIQVKNRFNSFLKKKLNKMNFLFE